MNFFARTGFAILIVIGLVGEGIALSHSYRLRNYMQIPVSLEAVTGVSRRESAIEKFYAERKGFFPVEGDPYELKTQFLTSEFNLSGLFCQSMIEQESMDPAELRPINRTIDFTRGPSQIDASNRRAVLQDFAEAFYQRDLDEEEFVILEELVKTLQSRLLDDSVESLKALLLGICTTFGTSFDFVRLP